MCTTQKSDAECGIETLVAKIRIEELLLEQLLLRRPSPTFSLWLVICLYSSGRCPCLDEERIRLARLARQSPIPSPATQNMALLLLTSLPLSGTGAGQCQVFQAQWCQLPGPRTLRHASGEEARRAMGCSCWSCV